MRIFAAVLCVLGMKERAWIWLARTLNQYPDTTGCSTAALVGFIDSPNSNDYSNKLLFLFNAPVGYPTQMKKIAHYIHNEYLPRITVPKITDTRHGFVRMVKNVLTNNIKAYLKIKIK